MSADLCALFDIHDKQIPCNIKNRRDLALPCRNSYFHHQTDKARDGPIRKKKAGMNVSIRKEGNYEIEADK